MSNMAEQLSIEAVINSLSEIQEDATVPRNVRTQIQNIISILKADTELSIRVSKVLNKLDEIAGDVNLEAYTRTQIWNVISILETSEFN